MRMTKALWEEAREGSPFSNSSQGEIWTANWCDRCWHDRGMRRPGNNGRGCPLLLIALSGKTPAQWFLPNEEAAIHGSYVCIEFRDERGGGGGEPRPKPTPPGQGELLPRGPYQGVRMLTPLHLAPQEVTTR